MKIFAKTLTVSLILLLAESQGWSHAAIVVNNEGQLTPRGSSTAYKTGPCGTVAGTTTPLPRRTTITTLKPGQTINFKWQEMIKHPGHFIISYSNNSDVFTPLPGKENIPEEPAKPTGDFYTTTVTLPNEECNDCTLQLIQVMTDNPVNPNYYSCADITLTNVVPNSTPSPDPNCP